MSDQTTDEILRPPQQWVTIHFRNGTTEGFTVESPQDIDNLVHKVITYPAGFVWFETAEHDIPSFIGTHPVLLNLQEVLYIEVGRLAK